MNIVEKEYCLQKNCLINNRYSIKETISQSELSIVYLAEDTLREEETILKEYFPRKLALRDIDYKTIIRRTPSVQEKYEKLKELFFNEALILKELNHKNIVRYIDHFEENGSGYIALEYFKGETLDQYIKNHKEINMVEFLKKTLLPLLDTVNFVHKKGIIHRDIKPKNILIGENLQHQLIDFGSAIYYEDQTEQQIFTTAGFSPLEFYSERSNQGIFSDIYSLCATVYFALSEEIPLDVSERLIKDNIKNVRHYNKGITPLLSYVIMQGLKVDYKKRFQSILLLKRAVYIESLIQKLKKLMK